MLRGVSVQVQLQASESSAAWLYYIGVGLSAPQSRLPSFQSITISMASVLTLPVRPIRDPAGADFGVGGRGAEPFSGFSRT